VKAGLETGGINIERETGGDEKEIRYVILERDAHN